MIKNTFICKNTIMSSILEAAKLAAKKAEQEKKQKQKENLENNEEDSSSDDEEDYIEPNNFHFYGHKWIKAPFMDEIEKGDTKLIPIECILTHCILKCQTSCFYICLEDHESGDEYEIYEFEWTGDFDENEENHVEPEFKVYDQYAKAVEIGRFLCEKIGDGYKIYIHERKEWEPI